MDWLATLVQSSSWAVTVALSVCPQNSPVTTADVSVVTDVEASPPTTWEYRV